MKPKTPRLVIFSFLYCGLYRLFELGVLVLRSEEAKEMEILVLRHQERMKPTPAAEVVQMLYSLQSTWGAVSSVRAKAASFLLTIDALRKD